MFVFNRDAVRELRRQFAPVVALLRDDKERVVRLVSYVRRGQAMIGERSEAVGGGDNERDDVEQQQRGRREQQHAVVGGRLRRMVAWARVERVVVVVGRQEDGEQQQTTTTMRRRRRQSSLAHDACTIKVAPLLAPCRRATMPQLEPIVDAIHAQHLD